MRELKVVHRKRNEMIDITSDIQKIVSDSIKNTSDILLRALNLTKTVTSQKPMQDLGGMELAERWAQFNLKASEIVSQNSHKAVNEILDVFEELNIIESPQKKADPHVKKRKTQPKAAQAKK